MPQRVIWYSSTASDGPEIAYAARDVISTFNHGDSIRTAAVANGVNLIEELVVARGTARSQTEIGNIEKRRLVVGVHSAAGIQNHVGWGIPHPDISAAHLPGQVRDIAVGHNRRQRVRAYLSRGRSRHRDQTVADNGSRSAGTARQ